MTSQKTLQELAAMINALAPERLAESWDNVGLQLGDPGMEVEGVMTVLECDRSTVEEAAALGANVIVAHHPLIFRPIKNLKTNTYTGSAISAILERGMGFICAHTNLDKAPTGTNRVMADRLAVQNLKLLHPEKPEALKKFVIFVPAGHEMRLINAIDEAGGGKIGRYGKCSFRALGKGTFEGDATTNPAIGEPGKMETVEEYRLETIVPASRLNAVVAAAIEAHPYEEVAYDVYTLDRAGEPEWGLGYVGDLHIDDSRWGGETPTLREFARKAEDLFDTDFLLVVGDEKRLIERVAVSSGAGGHSVSALSGGEFDVLVTGEMNYHTAVEARHKGMAVVCLGHFASETFVADALATELKTLLPEVKIHVAASASDPFWRP